MLIINEMQDGIWAGPSIKSLAKITWQWKKYASLVCCQSWQLARRDWIKLSHYHLCLHQQQDAYISAEKAFKWVTGRIYVTTLKGSKLKTRRNCISSCTDSSKLQDGPFPCLPNTLFTVCLKMNIFICLMKSHSVNLTYFPAFYVVLWFCVWSQIWWK